MVEDVNETHVEGWSEMLSKSSPPIDSTPISPFLGEHAFRSEMKCSLRPQSLLSEHAICLDGSKARRVLGFKPAVPTLQVEELKRIVSEFQADGLWSVTEHANTAICANGPGRQSRRFARPIYLRALEL
jgi:hypothetical protein